jgi:hypothetical protein
VPRIANLQAGKAGWKGVKARQRRWKQKKTRSLPTGPWKFWERMPERQVLYDSSPVISQVQKGYRVLIFLQQLHILLIMRGLRRF